MIGRWLIALAAPLWTGPLQPALFLAQIAAPVAQIGLATAPSSTVPLRATLSVDWETTIAQAAPTVYGSNDYEITKPDAWADPVFQNRLVEIGIPLIRVHNNDLSNRWTDPLTRTWNEAKIKAAYDASYRGRPTLVQNIPRWPRWMKQDANGLLDPSEHDNYAALCAALVDILNRRQGRGIVYWEPLNEPDLRYRNTGRMAEAWTLFNKAAVAMKARDPSIKVGGPVMAWDNLALLDDFLRKSAAHVDFISWHRYGSSNATDSTDNLMAYTPRYATQIQAIRAVVRRHIRDRPVPLLLGEYNINYSWKSGETRQNTIVGAVWFASVFKHLAEADIEMAASWHLKDGVYGMIDPRDQLRPAATVFGWANRYLTGAVVKTTSDQPFVETLAVRRADGSRSVLVINKAAGPATVTFKKPEVGREPLRVLRLDTEGASERTVAASTLAQPLALAPYSLVLLRF